MAKKVKYYIEVDEHGAVKGTGKVEEGILKVDDAANQTGISTIALGNIMANAASQMAQSIKQVVAQSQELFAQQEQAEQKALAVIKATGGAAGFEIDQLKQYAAEMQTYTTIGDEVILENMATMLTFRKVTGDTFTEAIELAADTAQVFGSFESATLQLGKALEDPIEGMTALRRVGVTFSEQQKEQVKDFLKQNDLAGAQAVILDNLRGQIGGVAREMALTDTGQWEQFLNRLGDSQEDFGKLLVSLKVGLIPVFDRLLDISGDLFDVFKNLAGLDLATQLNNERIQMNALVMSITSLNEGNARREELISELLESYPDFIGRIDEEKVTNEELKEALEDVNQVYIDRAAIQISTAQQEKAIEKAGQALIEQKQKEQSAYQELIRLNEEYGLGIDLSTGTIEQNLVATRNALSERGKWTESATLGRIAVNDEAHASSRLLGIQNELVVAYNKLADAQNNVVEASEFRTMIEESLIQSGSEVIPVNTSIEIQIPDAPELPEVSNIEPIQVPIEFGGISESELQLPEINWDQVFFIPDGTLETLNQNLAKIDLMPDSTIANLQDQLAKVQDLYVHAQSDAERKRLAEVERSIQMQIQAKQEGIEVERAQLEAWVQEQSDLWSGLYSTASEYVNVFSQFQKNAADRQIKRIDKETKTRVASINTQLEMEHLSEAQRRELMDQRAELEDEAEIKKTEIKRETFNKEKRAKTVMGIAETALAVIEALPNIPLSVAVGILGAAQTGLIASQPNPYLEGGQVLERMPDGKTTPGMKMISINENGEPEYIVNADSTRRFEPLLDLINYSPGEAEQILRGFGIQPFLDGGQVTESLMDLPAGAVSQAGLGIVADVSGSIPQTSLNALIGQQFNELPVIENQIGDLSEVISEAIESGFDGLNKRFKIKGRDLEEIIEGVLERKARDIFEGLNNA